MVVALLAMPSPVRAVDGGTPDSAQVDTEEQGEPLVETLDHYRRLLKGLQLEQAEEFSPGAGVERRERFARAKRAARRLRTHPERLGARLVPYAPQIPQTAGPVEINASPAIGSNRRMNERLTDRISFSAQSEVTLAAFGGRLVAAWNDGETVAEPGPLGWGFSVDGGNTWVDGGSLPVTPELPVWQSDPVLTVDHEGTFFLAGLAISTKPLANALAVVRGAFTDSGFAWQPPIAVRASRDTLPDKPWLTCDPRNGHLYVSYTTFFTRGGRRRDQIELQRSVDGGLSWAPSVTVSPPEDAGLVQGSRPAVGPDGELHVVWMVVDTLDTGGRDAMHVRTSHDGGATFGFTSVAGRFTTNFGSGAPGFNRGTGVNFPGVAVDRSNGPHRGRVYVTWCESLNFYDDVPGSLRATKVRSVRNDAPTPARFTPGNVLRGNIAGSGAVVRFQFHALAGETFTFLIDSLTPRMDLSLRVTCPVGESRLAYNQSSGSRRFLLVTAPITGAYFIRLQTNTPVGGAFRMQTGRADRSGEGGRDQRDAFIASSPTGRFWSFPVRVSTGPPQFDDWLPEVAVADDGTAYVAWYSWRQPNLGGCGVVSDVLLSRSTDGGVTWNTLGALTDRASDWSIGGSSLIPNQGDYIAIAPDGSDVQVGWGDARNRDPDAFTARVTNAAGPVGPGGPPSAGAGVAVLAARPNPSRGDVTLECALAPRQPARLTVLDLAGRAVRRLDVEPDGAGRAWVRVPIGPDLRPGVYIARLEQSGRRASIRFAIVR